MSGAALETVVCGSRWGQFYAAALAAGDPRFRLAGILAHGSERSRALAERHGVPLYRSVAQVPASVEAACVVVPSAVAGGPGAELTAEFLTRGVHVLQEHPVHERELADAVRLARARGVHYQLTTFYPHVEPVDRFIRLVRGLLARHPAVHIDAVCAVQVSFDLLDILARALGGLRPWQVESAEPASAGPGPYRSLVGTVAGVPLTLRVQNQMVAGDDSHTLALHRIAVGTDAGTLTLAATHGPLLWSPPLHPEPGPDGLFVLDGARDPHLALPSTAALGPATAPSWAEVTGGLWPEAVRAALGELLTRIRAGAGAAASPQRLLTVARAWHELTARLGYPEVVAAPPPAALSAARLCALAEPALAEGAS